MLGNDFGMNGTARNGSLPLTSLALLHLPCLLYLTSPLSTLVNILNKGRPVHCLAILTTKFGPQPPPPPKEERIY